MTHVTPTKGLVDYLLADQTLKALAPGGVWKDPAPRGRQTPLVVVKLMNGDDEFCGGGGSALTECHYLAKVVGPANQIDQINQGAARLHGLLDFGLLVQQGLGSYRVLASRRTNPIEYDEPEPVTGIRWEHLGGIYQIDVEATS